jgi:hypothetical protein
MIDNITTNGAISIVVADGSSNSVINIDNSTFNPTAAPLDIYVASPASTIDIRSGADGAKISTVTVNSIDNNTFNFTSIADSPNYQNAIALFGNTVIDVSYDFQPTLNNGYVPAGESGRLNITSVSDNKINFGDNVFGAGIRINYSFYNQAIGNLNNNTIVFGDFALPDKAFVAIGGIVITNPFSQNAQTQTITSVSGNHITFGDGLSQQGFQASEANRLAGIYLNNQGTTVPGDPNNLVQNIGAVDNNVIMFGNDASVLGNSGVITGIWLGTNSEQTVKSMSNNSITFGTGATVSNSSASLGQDGGNQTLTGIYIFNYGGTTQTVKALTDNTIIFGSGASASNRNLGTNVPVTLAGIYTSSYGGNANNTAAQTQNISLSNNQVTFSGTTNAEGMTSTTGLVGGFVFFNNAIRATSVSTSTFSFVNNTVAFEGVQSGSDTSVNTYGINVITNSSTASAVFSDFYGNNITGSNGAFAIQNAQLVNSVTGGTITININDPTQPNNLGGINGLIQANNDIQFPSGQGAGTTINALTPA